MTNLNEIREIVGNTDYETLQNFVVNLLSEDENLVMRLRLLSNNELTEEDFDQYKKRYQEIVNPNVETGSFVPYRKAMRMERGLNDFLTEDVTGLVNNKYFEEAFDITKLIFLRLNKLNIDDSGGVVHDIIREIFRVWQAILNQGPKTIATIMFRWIISRHDHLGDTIDLDQYLSFLLDNFREPNQMERKLQIAGQQIEELEGSTQPWSYPVDEERWAKFYLELSEQIEDEDKIERFIAEHLHLFEVRNFAIERHISKAEYDEAIELLKEGRAIEFKGPALNRQYTIQLKELYKIKRNREAYLNELWLRGTKYEFQSLEPFNELKAQYSDEEWAEVREEIFQALPENAHLADYYRNEGLEERILEYVQNSTYSGDVLTYEPDLKDKYPDEMLDVYEKFARDRMEMANERRLYREVLAFTKGMLDYPDGRARVDKLIEEWIVEYKHRPAMIEELEKIK